MVIDHLSQVGRILSCEPRHYFSTLAHDIALLLHKPVPIYKPEAAPPNCLFITRRLVACTRLDYVRLSGSIIMEAQTHFGIWFVGRPKAKWIGYGRLRKKAVETVRLMVDEREDRDWDMFCRLVRGGFAYER